MTEILIENMPEEAETDDSINLLIKKCADAVLEYENCDFDAEISVSIVSEEEIKALNSEYRNKNSVTDVLSFPMLETDEDGTLVYDECDFNGDKIMLGDIVICAKRAREQAQAYNHSYEREIAFLTVHSMLHLLGYDHEHSEDMEQEMFKKQKEILDKMGITREQA